ncbi:MAG TPA: TonB family protein [Candidatus Krumholzibacteria bacterium]|nr:TonB family protein [Candidatus Krumholzibacteria bacterium]
MTHARRIIFAACVVALLLLAFAARRTGVDSLFRREWATSAGDSTAVPMRTAPDAVVSIHIDPETDASGVIDVSPPPPPPPAARDTTRVRPERKQPDRKPDLGVDDLLNQEAGPHDIASSTAVGPVPPRPIEITWPETRQLKQCIGQSVSVRIRVSENGRVQDAQVVPSDVLPACAEAALAAARHIRFEPGRQGGVPVTMWTEVRIDFQRRD